MAIQLFLNIGMYWVALIVGLRQITCKLVPFCRVSVLPPGSSFQRNTPITACLTHPLGKVFLSLSARVRIKPPFPTANTPRKCPYSIKTRVFIVKHKHFTTIVTQ